MKERNTEINWRGSNPEIWTRSSVGESRYRRGTVLRRVRYGVVSMPNQSSQRSGRNSSGKTETQEAQGDERRADRSKHIYSRSILRCRIGATIRRTKLEVGGNERTRRRSGKRIQTYATETVKLVRRRTTRGCRILSSSSSVYTGGSSGITAYEYPILMMLATRGLIRLVNTNDRIGMYVGIEWLSLCLYVIAAFRRGSAYSTEAGLKYYVVGAFGSAWMLLGMTLVYGWRGTLNRMEIERRRGRSDYGSGEWILYRIGWQFVRGALLLKLAGVPMHRWLADVYEGAPRSSVLYFAVVPKIALFRVRMRRVSIWYVQRSDERSGRERVSVGSVTKRRIFVSLRSMGVGAIGALTQRRRKRFRAYSAIGHTGYMLLGVRRGTVEGVQGVRIYTRVYRVMTMVMWQRRRIVKVYEGSPSTGIQVRDVKYRTDRYQLGKENPVLGRLIARTCMSIAGVPPMAGFGAKRSVFRPLVSSSYYRLAATAVRRSVIGAFNYVRRVKRIFFEEGVEGVTTKREEISVILNKDVARRRGLEGIVRTRLRMHPSSLLLRTHRMALQLVSR